MDASVGLIEIQCARRIERVAWRSSTGRINRTESIKSLYWTKDRAVELIRLRARTRGPRPFCGRSNRDRTSTRQERNFGTPVLSKWRWKREAQSRFCGFYTKAFVVYVAAESTAKPITAAFVRLRARVSSSSLCRTLFRVLGGPIFWLHPQLWVKGTKIASLLLQQRFCNCELAPPQITVWLLCWQTLVDERLAIWC